MEKFDNVEDFIKELPKYLGMCRVHPSCLEYLSDIRVQLSELKSYKDAEEQGLILRLQVAIGNIVYRINEYADEPIISMNVTSIEIKGITDTFKEMKCKECGFGGEFTYRFSDIGKTVFLTKEEAEQALKQMGE